MSDAMHHKILQPGYRQMLRDAKRKQIDSREALGMRVALMDLGLLPKPAKPTKKCRTCKGTGLADSGVPSMPMPCPKCCPPIKPAKRRKSRK